MANFMILWWLNLCHQGSCSTVCLQVCWESHFLERYNLRYMYVTEKSLTDAKSIAWRRLALNLVLLRNLQQLCCTLWPSAVSDVFHHMITFFWIIWNQWCVEWPKEKAISTIIWDQLVHVALWANCRCCVTCKCNSWLLSSSLACNQDHGQL